MPYEWNNNRDEDSDGSTHVPRQEHNNRPEVNIPVEAEEFEVFEAAPPNTEVNFEAMAENYFAGPTKFTLNS